MAKPAGNCGFGYIYWRNPWWKTSFFVKWNLRGWLGNWVQLGLRSLVFFPATFVFSKLIIFYTCYCLMALKMWIYRLNYLTILLLFFCFDIRLYIPQKNRMRERFIKKTLYFTFSTFCSLNMKETTKGRAKILKNCSKNYAV